MVDPTLESLWEFALHIYRRERVAPLCLRLQDEHGLDVDILLACLWLAARGQPIDGARHLDAIIEAAAPAHAWVEQIRALRRAMGSARQREPEWEASYEHLKAAELDAERVELARIEAAIGSTSTATGDPTELARDGLHRYARRVTAYSCDALLDDLATAALGRGPESD